MQQGIHRASRPNFRPNYLAAAVIAALAANAPAYGDTVLSTVEVTAERNAGSLNLEFYINDKAFNALPSEYKAIVQAAAHEAHVVTQGRYDARNPGALKQLVGAKTKVLAFPPTVMDASFKTTMELYAQLNASNPDWKKIYADYRNFQRDQVLWFRFAESSFDNFMQRQKL